MLLRYLTRNGAGLVDSWLTADRVTHVAVAPLWPQHAVSFQLHWLPNDAEVEIIFRGSRLLSSAMAGATRLLHHTHPQLIEAPRGVTDQEQLGLSAVLDGADGRKQQMALQRCRER